MMTMSFKRRPWRLLQWQARSALLFAGFGLIAYGLIEQLGFDFLKLPVVPLSIVGAAIGIFASFRANQSYDRWWEGRKLWGRMINSSRYWSSQVVQYTRPEDRAVAETLVLRHVA